VIAVLALLSLAAAGVLAGLLSGLVGVGGGVIMVPILYLFYAYPAWAGVTLGPDAATLTAHATSLFVIFPTSVRGTLAFHQKGMVAWRVAWPIGIAAAIAAVLASRVAVGVDARVLRLAFGVLLVYTAYRLFRSRDTRRAARLAERPLRTSPPVTVGTGAVVGFFSAFLGVGGGIVAIPLLMQVVRLDLRRVAATSLAIVAVTSAAGAAAYMLSGLAAPVRAGWSVGYVDVAAGLALAAGTLLSVRWGASLNLKLEPRRLALVFGALFLAMGARLILVNFFG
jgi:uncharacterized protein